MERWRGKVALVTGASSGIGRAVALRLLGEGMRVAACARRIERVEALAGEVAGAALLPLRADLREPAQIDAMFAAIRDRWGGVDVVVNNAGVGARAPLVSGDTESWRAMLEVTVLAVAICTREAVTDMRRRGDDGHVVHISSMSGHRVTAGIGMYAATKHGVTALTEGLRQELRALGSRIRVTAISPGFVETEFAEKATGSKKLAQETYARYPVIQPDEIADAVVYALSRPPHVQLHDILLRPTEQAT
jgi:NADP-dependent 3-hydroxy acid dehydrogenase YdfG